MSDQTAPTIADLELLPPALDGPATLYQRMLMSKKTERTREAYASDLADFAAFLGVDSLAHLPDAAWRELDVAHVAAYLEHLKNTGSKTSTPVPPLATRSWAISGSCGHKGEVASS